MSEPALASTTLAAQSRFMDQFMLMFAASRLGWPAPRIPVQLLRSECGSQTTESTSILIPPSALRPPHLGYAAPVTIFEVAKLLRARYGSPRRHGE